MLSHAYTTLTDCMAFLRRTHPPPLIGSSCAVDHNVQSIPALDNIINIDLDTCIIVVSVCLLQEMLAAVLEMEGRVPGWRSGLIPFAKDADDTFLVSSDGTDTHT